MEVMQTKGLKQFLEDDNSLLEPISYEEFQDNKAAPGNSDDMIADVYACYRKVIGKYKEDKEVHSEL